MMTRRQASAGLLSSGAFAARPAVLAQETGAMELWPPRTDGGKPLIQALSLRRSIREYADKPLTAANTMKLRAGQFVTFAQTVGYPKI